MKEIEQPAGDPVIEAPPRLLPDLSEWGIEEIERGVCEDTFPNRRTIKQNNAHWIPVFDTNGYPTTLIQVISHEMQQRARASEKQSILKDPKNPDSDFLTGFSLLIEPTAPDVVPTWVLRTTRNWQKLEDQREALGSDAGALDSRLVYPPGRCNAKKADGSRCWGWHNGTTDWDFLCRVHNKTHAEGKGRALYGPSQKQIAQNRLASGLVGALEVIEELMVNADSEQVRLAAAKDWADRGGLRGAIEIEQKIEVNDSAAREIVLKNLAKLKEGIEGRQNLVDSLQERFTRKPEEDIEDAEVVEDD
jgi:hypothetical protein